MKKRIMIDMDDVIVSGGFLHLLNEFMYTNYKEEDFNEFYMQDIVPNKKEFFNYFLKHNLYDYCEIKDSAIEVIKKLSKNFDIYICTSYIYKEIIEDSGIILKYKYDYLLKYFPFLNPSNFIFTGDKSVINCDIKIDDRVENLENSNIKILFSAYHNKNISDKELKEKNILRVNNWSEIKNLLLNNQK